MSYFGRINYNYRSKYMLEAQGRYDGSSKFSPKTVGYSIGVLLPDGEFQKKHS